MNHEELQKNLRELSLHGIAKEYPELSRIAEKKNCTYEQFIGMLATVEIKSRAELKVKRLTKDSKIPLLKEQSTYDFKCIKGITEIEFNRLAEGAFLNNATNIVLYGSFGLGKTHLSIALSRKLIEKGYRCFYTTTHNLIQDLLEAQKTLKLGAIFKKLDKYQLLVCDELGYIPQTKDGADLFFQLISQRNERKSILITTNLPFSDWGQVFVNPLNTAAAVDRIIHNCETFNLEGPSYRTVEAKKRHELKTSLTVKNKATISTPSTGPF